MANVQEMAKAADEWAARQLPDSHMLSMRYRRIRDERFAELVRAEERERCAVICEQTVVVRREIGGFKTASNIDCAEAIRGQQGVR